MLRSTTTARPSSPTATARRPRPTSPASTPTACGRRWSTPREPAGEPPPRRPRRPHPRSRRGRPDPRAARPAPSPLPGRPRRPGPPAACSPARTSTRPRSRPSPSGRSWCTRACSRVASTRWPASPTRSPAPNRPARTGSCVHLDPDDVQAWLAVLNDARLALGTRIGVTDDTDLGARPDTRRPRGRRVRLAHRGLADLPRDLRRARRRPALGDLARIGSAAPSFEGGPVGYLDGKTIAVTGAGRGIGRAVALAAAAAGANVVVNDYGVSIDGQDPNSDIANEVVAEITAAGGQAVAVRRHGHDHGRRRPHRADRGRHLRRASTGSSASPASSASGCCSTCPKTSGTRSSRPT